MLAFSPAAARGSLRACWPTMGSAFSFFGERWRNVGHVKDEWERHAREGEASQVVSKLTEAQLAEYRDAFNSFDKDGGGSIDKAELKELMSSVGQNPTDDELAEMIRIADADGTGDIDFAEFVTLMAHKMTEPESEERVKGAFAVFDESGDGYVDAEEMRNLMMNVGEPATIEDIRKVLSDVDTDGDGTINYTEFARVVTNRVRKGRDTSGLSSTSHLSSKSLTGGAP